MGFKVGASLMVGPADTVGEDVVVGESLGPNDGAKEGGDEGDADVDGN